MVKSFVAETLGRITDRAVQICGSHGIATDQPIAEWFAQARAARITDGPSGLAVIALIVGALGVLPAAAALLTRRNIA